MGDVFLKLLNISITAGWLILAVLCIRLIFRKIPKWITCLLWGMAAIRLICPFFIESQFSILPSTELIKNSAVVEGEIQNYIPSIDSHLTIVENTINPMLKENFAYNESESAAPLQIVTYVAGMAWVCGMILLIICIIGSMIRLHKLVREAVRVKDNIYICDAVKSPFILGIVRPRIYLSSALSEKEINYIIAHESAHLKRKDHWWKFLGYLLLCIYWFNPLCWVAYAMFCKDIELACDEKVAKDMTLHEKKEYSKVLLSCTRQRSLIMVCPLTFGEVGIKERVKFVLNYKKPALWIMIATAVVFVILAICFLTNPTKEYQIRITIPAKSTGTFSYSDEEISPKGNTLTFYAGKGLGDTEIRLLPIEVKEENTYDKSTYITQGMSVEMDAEKGGWFKIGVNIQNPTDKSKDVYISVENVEVRIASLEENNESDLLSEQLPDNKITVQKGSLKKNVSSQAEEMPIEKDSIQDIMLYEQPEANKVCIEVRPSMLRESIAYYYIPTDEDQKWLLEQIKALDLEGKPSDWDRPWKEHKETGWEIIYNDVRLMGFEDGYLYYTYYDDKEGMIECFIEVPKLCDYIQIMLIEDIGYQTYDASDIKDIVSAKLDVNSISTGWQFYSQTITDKETLQKFEEWFQNAKYIFGGADCGNECACLELTLANGNIVKLSMATDSCSNFSIDGVAYDYRPMLDWDNSEFFKCFNEIPWEWE